MTADALALRVHAAVQAGRSADALAVMSEALRAAAGRPALQARLHAWGAQAHMASGDLDAADAALLRAKGLAVRAGDRAGLRALKGLEEQSAARRVAQSRVIGEGPAARALAALQDGDEETGVRLAQQAREMARKLGDAREEVLSLLVLSRVDHLAAQAIAEAAQVADESGDWNLITAVARGARVAGIPIPARVF